MKVIGSKLQKSKHITLLSSEDVESMKDIISTVQTVYMCHKNGDMTLLGRRQTIILNQDEDHIKGFLKDDGREVKLINGKWVYYAQ